VTFSLVGSVVDVITTVLTTVGLPGLFALMVAESFGLPPVPSEVILPFTGFLIAEGRFPLGASLAVAVAGGLVGSFAAYAVGRWWRSRITDLGIGRLRLEARHLERMDRFFARRGELTVGVARLVPVVRAYISYPAGAAKMNPLRFGAYTVAGSIPFTAALVYSGMVLQSNWALVSSNLHYIDLPLVAAIVFVAAYLLLQIAGVLEPGWPPRRATRTPAHRAVSGVGRPSGPAPPRSDGEGYGEQPETAKSSPLNSACP
jgi:membrane protein DedA with SNARE-associated domain